MPRVLTTIIGMVCAMLSYETAYAQDRGFVETFRLGMPEEWHVADYAFTHPMFDTDWSSERILRTVDHGGGLELSLAPKSGGPSQFEGASIRRKSPAGFGRYEVTLQAARGQGVVTGAFVYTGPYYGTRHDEVDIEFLGKDTTRILVSWFVDGKVTSHWIPLGFDAAEKPRRYAFEWHADRIAWFVEGNEIFEITSRDTVLPSVPGYFFTNIWAVAPSMSEWAGMPAPQTQVSATLMRAAFYPVEGPSREQASLHSPHDSTRKR